MTNLLSDIFGGGHLFQPPSHYYQPRKRFVVPPDSATPRMQQLLEQGLTWEEARETLQHEIDSGKLKNPNVIPAP